MDMGRGEGRVRCIERVTWKHIIICKIDSQWEFAVMFQETQTGALYQPRGVAPGSSVHGIFQARVLEWGAIAFWYTYIPSCLNLPPISLIPTPLG